MARDGERGRGDWNARRGSRNSGPYAGASEDSGPVDIAAVRRDDALIEAISSDGPVQTDSTEEFQLAALLADWRAEIIEPPLPGAPDLDVVFAAVNQEIGARKVRVSAQTGGRLRLVRPLLGTAAAVALVIGGLTAFSYNAEPGNPLWRVKEVVFSEQAQSTVVNRADSQIDQAEQLLAKGDPTAAKVQLESALANVDQVTDPDKRAQLQADWQRMLDTLRAKNPALAEQITTATRTPDPRPSTAPGGNPSTAPSQPGQPQQPASQQTTPNPTIMQLPIETTGGSVPPVTQQPTQPNEPGPTTVPPVTQEPPTQEPPTQSPPTTVNSPTVVVPTGGAEIPTQPTNQLPNPGITIPSIPLPIPGG